MVIVSCCIGYAICVAIEPGADLNPIDFHHKIYLIQQQLVLGTSSLPWPENVTCIDVVFVYICAQLSVLGR